ARRPARCPAGAPLGGPVALPSRRQRPALLVLRAHASRPRTRPDRRAGLLLRPALRSPRPVRASPAAPRPSARRPVPPAGPGRGLAGLGEVGDWMMPLFRVAVGVDAARRGRCGGWMRFLAASVGACLVALMLAATVAAWVSGPVGTHELATALGFRLELHGQY